MEKKVLDIVEFAKGDNRQTEEWIERLGRQPAFYSSQIRKILKNGNDRLITIRKETTCFIPAVDEIQYELEGAIYTCGRVEYYLNRMKDDLNTLLGTLSEWGTKEEREKP